MAALLRYIAARPWPFLSVLALMSLLAGLQLPRLQIDVFPQSLSIEGNEAREFYRRTVDVFGGDNITILFFKDPDLFAPARLSAIRDLIAELEALPYVVRTESLFSLPNLRTDDDGYVHTEAYLAAIPETKEQAAAVRIAAIKNPFVRRNLLSEDGTAMAVNVYIDDTERKPGFDQTVFERFEQALAPLSENLAQVFQIGLPLSLADYVAQLHSVVNETGEPELPQFDEELAELLMFVKQQHIRGYVSDDFSRATLVLRHSVGDSETLTRALAGLEAFAARTLDPGLGIWVTGESVLSSRAADYITVGQIKSLGLILLAIFVVIGLLFANIRAGLLAIVPNVFPIIILFGVMGYAGIPLNTGTALIAAIAIGICVDNTMHFMVRYNRELHRHRSEMAAIDATLRAEAMPIPQPPYSWPWDWRPWR